MRFKPVFLPDDRRLNGRMSQTFLRHFNACPRSGYLYAFYKGEASTVEMQRGKALHRILERARKHAIEHDEPVIPGEIVKVIANEVLEEIPVAVEEHDFIRESAYRWAREAATDPSAVIACETLFALDIAGVEVRAKIDYAELRDGGAVMHVEDYKSSRAAVPFDDLARKRPDGSLAAKAFQLVLYAVMLAFGVPVREERCTACGGTGRAAPDKDHYCLSCSSNPASKPGRGVCEIREPFSVAGRAQRFDVEFVYPGIEDREGGMVRRPMSLTRLELVEYRASIEAVVRQVLAAEESGDWPAVVSGPGCGECPASSLCPIPRELRDHRGTINTVEEAVEAAAVLDREEAERKARREEIKRFVQRLPGQRLRFGADQVWEFAYQETTRIADKDAMFAAVERHALYGEPFERSQFVKTVKSTPFRQRSLTGVELAEERAEGSEAEEAA